jgi:N6-adenosine-specific RNA methylase IME4
LPLEHTGGARWNAARRWSELGGHDPVPATVDEALRRQRELGPVAAIAVQRDGRYWSVVARRLSAARGRRAMRYTRFADLPRHHFGLIVADPPWRHITYDGRNPKLDCHYTQMDLVAIKALDIAALARRDCVLALWVPQAQMANALDVVAAWRFKFKTTGCWAKRTKTDQRWQFGTGHILRSTAEYYLLATRGSPRCKVHNVRNLIVAPVREHSRKPDQLFDDLARMYPDVPRLELFACIDHRPGWVLWGNQVRYLAEELAP